MGLSGLGDLVLTATGDLSRNRQVGLLLAQGRTLPQALALARPRGRRRRTRTHGAAARAARWAWSMPITACVVALLDGEVTPAEAVRL